MANYVTPRDFLVVFTHHPRPCAIILRFEVSVLTPTAVPRHFESTASEGGCEPVKRIF